MPGSGGRLSAFVVIYERSNITVDPGILVRAMEQLKHRGPDGSDVLLAGNVALGHWHFWTTPEEVGERQPLQINGLPFKIVLDGRIDNREELFTKLNITSAEGRSLSDAGLILHAYALWGNACLEHLIGEYAFVILDASSGQLLCARDAIGERSLFYAWHGTRLVIASEAWAAASIGGLPLHPEFNETGAARYFAMKANEDGQTMFKNVCELLPAYSMLVTVSSSHLWRYWQPDPIRRVRCRSDEEYAGEFRALLEESVRCRMRSNAPVGVSMSGGLDSGSVACLAASMSAPQPLTTLSYVFDDVELADCDEREYIESIKKQWDIHSIQFPGDRAWPFKDWQNWPRNPNRPYGNPFRLLLELVYHHAEKEGLRVLLTGGGGDQLYGAGVNWFADLLGEGRVLQAWRELMNYISQNGLRKALTAGFLQRAVRRLLNVIPIARHLFHSQSAPAWLTPLSLEAIRNSENRPDSIIEQYTGLLGMGIASSYSGEASYANRHVVELRHPYRDRRLIEFVLALPAYQLYYNGLYKHILRTAMKDILPETIRTRSKPATHNQLFIRGFEREKILLQACFENPEAAWSKFTDSDWVKKNWKIMLTSTKFRHEDVVLWACPSYEAWYASFA